MHFSWPNRHVVAPTSWSAVLAASSPPEQSLVLQYRLHRPRGTFDLSVGRETHATAGQEAGAANPLTHVVPVQGAVPTLVERQRKAWVRGIPPIHDEAVEWMGHPGLCGTRCLFQPGLM